MSEDRRVRRTRERLRSATLRLLDEGPDRLTVAAVAAAADVNRSTVHQHYRDLDDLICDALAEQLHALAATMIECPFAEDRDRPPRQLVAWFAAVSERRELLDRLAPSVAARVERQLAESLTGVLVERFRAGQRPRGDHRVRPETHARFVAAGLVALAFHGPEADTAGRRAGQAWRLIRGPVSDAVRAGR